MIFEIRVAFCFVHMLRDTSKMLNMPILAIVARVDDARFASRAFDFYRSRVDADKNADVEVDAEAKKRLDVTSISGS